MMRAEIKNATQPGFQDILLELDLMSPLDVLRSIKPFADKLVNLPDTSGFVAHKVKTGLQDLTPPSINADEARGADLKLGAVRYSKRLLELLGDVSKSNGYLIEELKVEAEEQVRFLIKEATLTQCRDWARTVNSILHSFGRNLYGPEGLAEIAHGELERLSSSNVAFTAESLRNLQILARTISHRNGDLSIAWPERAQVIRIAISAAKSGVDYAAIVGFLSLAGIDKPDALKEFAAAKRDDTSEGTAKANLKIFYGQLFDELSLIKRITPPQTTKS
jgi:hypothetical protein